MKKLLACLTILVGVACSGALAHAPVSPDYRPGNELRNALASSYRIRIYCGEELAGYGSGVAIDNRHVLTARHVVEACLESDTPDMEWFELVDYNGRVYEAALDRKASDEEIDVARLVVNGAAEFPTWAPIATAPPNVLDRVFLLAGDGSMDRGYGRFFPKDGYVSGIIRDQLVVSIHGVPGNSGSAIFDVHGQVVGILHSGRWDASKEFFVFAALPKTWYDLFPGFQMEMNNG